VEESSTTEETMFMFFFLKKIYGAYGTIGIGGSVEVAAFP
jgi:hypothetical protein